MTTKYVHALAAGSTTLRVTAGGQTVDIPITVQAAPVSSGATVARFTPAAGNGAQAADGTVLRSTPARCLAVSLDAASLQRAIAANASGNLLQWGDGNTAQMYDASFFVGGGNLTIRMYYAPALGVVRPLDLVVAVSSLPTTGGVVLSCENDPAQTTGKVRAELFTEATGALLGSVSSDTLNALPTGTGAGLLALGNLQLSRNALPGPVSLRWAGMLSARRVTGRHLPITANTPTALAAWDFRTATAGTDPTVPSLVAGGPAMGVVGGRVYDPAEDSLVASLAIPHGPRAYGVVGGADEPILTAPEGRNAWGDVVTGATVTVSVADPTKASIVAGKVHALAAGETGLVFACQGRTVTAPLRVLASGPYAGSKYRPLYEQPHQFDAAGTDTGELPYNAATGAVDGLVFDPFGAAIPTTATIVGLATNTPAQNRDLVVARMNALLTTGGRVRIKRGARVAGFHRPARAAGAPTISFEHEGEQDGTINAPAGQRIQHPVTGALLVDTTDWPKFEVGPTGEVHEYDNGAYGYREVGIEGRYDPSTLASVAGLDGNGNFAKGIWIGLGQRSFRGNFNLLAPGTAFQAGDFQSGSPDPADYPRRITFDRCYGHGEAGKALLRVWDMSGGFIAYVDCGSRYAGVNSNDGQAVHIGSGAGPLLVLRSVLASNSRSESFMCGGGDYTSNATVPKHMQFRASGFLDESGLAVPNGDACKELLELKGGAYVSVEDCDFVGHPGNIDQTQYYAIVPKTIVQNGPADRVVAAHDVTYRRNRFHDVACPFQVVGTSEPNANDVVHHIEFAHNLIPAFRGGTPTNRSSSNFMSIGNMPDDGVTVRTHRPHEIAIRYNTGIGPAGTYPNGYEAWLFIDNIAGGVPLDGFRFEGNIAVLPTSMPNAYISGNGRYGSNAAGTVALAPQINGTRLGRNAIVNLSPGNGALVAGDIGYATMTTAGIDLAGTLTPSSPLRTADSDGGRLGAEPALLGLPS